MDEIQTLLGHRPVSFENFELEWEPGCIRVLISGGRRQLVRYREQEGYIIFRSTAATAAVVEQIGRARICEAILHRNRTAEVLSFRLTENDRLEATIAQRADRLDREELLLYVSLLARETDRMEYLLTGSDRH